MARVSTFSPSPSQLRVLTEMSRGNVLHRCVHTRLSAGTSYFLSKGMETIRQPTVSALLKLGYIEDAGDSAWRWRGSHYGLTEAGKAVVAQPKPDEEISRVRELLEQEKRNG